MVNAHYLLFIEKLKELRKLTAIRSLLFWDQRTYMPAKAGGARADQLSALDSVIHEKKTASDFVSLVRDLSADESLQPDERVNVRELWKEVERRLLLPPELVRSLSELSVQTQELWVIARRENNFRHVQRSFQELLKCKQAYADCIRRDLSRYDALYDVYEPGGRSNVASNIFSVMKPRLNALVEKLEKRPQAVAKKVSFALSKNSQRELSMSILREVGFDFETGRFDETVHPFCSGIAIQDVRVTTRYDEDDFSSAYLATMHELGHAFYDLGLSRHDEYTPLGEACSLAIHESQSLFWENRIGRSKEFFNLVYKELQRHSCPAGVANSDRVCEQMNQVARTLIRVGADEVTYGLHIIIRFELEQALVEGTLSIEELPSAWNDSYERILGIRPANDADGVLQDTHWYAGAFGYFPTYLLGAMYASQLYSALEREHPDISTEISNGDVSTVLSWLRKKIHLQGRRYRAPELIAYATGSTPDCEPYLSYLERKYS